MIKTSINERKTHTYFARNSHFPIALIKQHIETKIETRFSINLIFSKFITNKFLGRRKKTQQHWLKIKVMPINLH